MKVYDHKFAIDLAANFLSGGISAPFHADTTYKIATAFLEQDIAVESMRHQLRHLEASEQALQVELRRASARIRELEAALNETIPVLERNGRAILAEKLRKVIHGR
jgi:chromosomal replication initiation ATPase DnaA